MADDTGLAPKESVIEALRGLPDGLAVGGFRVSIMIPKVRLRRGRPLAPESGRGRDDHRRIAPSASDYPRAARRPHNAALSHEKLRMRLGIQLAPWEAALDGVLRTLSAHLRRAESPAAKCSQPHQLEGCDLLPLHFQSCSALDAGQSVKHLQFHAPGLCFEQSSPLTSYQCPGLELWLPAKIRKANLATGDHAPPFDAS